MIILTHHTQLLGDKYGDNIDILYYTGKRADLWDLFAKKICMKKIDWSKVKAEGVSLIIVGHVCYHKDVNNDYQSGFNYTTVTNKVVCKS